MIGPRTAATTDTHLPPWSVTEADGRRDAFYLMSLWHHYWGTEYEPNRLPRPLAQIAGWTDAEDSVDVLGTVVHHTPSDRDGTVPIGGGLVSIPDRETVDDLLPDGRFDADVLVPKRTAWLWFGAVDPAWRGRGIGYEMFRQRVEWAEMQGAGMVLATGWERREGRSSRPLFEAFDFVPIQTFEDHYAESRDACPDCGVWPGDDESCRCAATLWALDLPVDRPGGVRGR